MFILSFVEEQKPPIENCFTSEVIICKYLCMVSIQLVRYIRICVPLSTVSLASIYKFECSEEHKNNVGR